MRREYLPEHSLPFKQDIREIKRIENPRPVIGAQVQGFLGAGGLGVADVAAIEVREDVETADDGHDATVKLLISVSMEWMIRGWTDLRRV